MGKSKTICLLEENKIPVIINYIATYFEPIDSPEQFFSGEYAWKAHQKRLFFSDDRLDVLFDEQLVEAFGQMLKKTAASLELDFFTQVKSMFHHCFGQIEKHPQWAQFLQGKKLNEPHEREAVNRHFRYHFIFKLLSCFSNKEGKNQKIASLRFIQRAFACLRESENYPEFSRKMSQWCLQQMKELRKEDYFFCLLKKKYQSRDTIQQMLDSLRQDEMEWQDAISGEPEPSYGQKRKDSEESSEVNGSNSPAQRANFLAELTLKLEGRCSSPAEPVIRKKTRSNSRELWSIFTPPSEKENTGSSEPDRVISSVLK